MRHNKLLTITLFFIVVTLFTACKKDRTPVLKVHVQEADGTLAAGATVRVYHGDPTPLPSNGPINEDLDQEGKTDARGDIIFRYTHSAVLDVEVTYLKFIIPTSTFDTLTGRSVVKIESIRQRSKTNEFNEIVEVN